MAQQQCCVFLCITCGRSMAHRLYRLDERRLVHSVTQRAEKNFKTCTVDGCLHAWSVRSHIQPGRCAGRMTLICLGHSLLSPTLSSLIIQVHASSRCCAPGEFGVNRKARFFCGTGYMRRRGCSGSCRSSGMPGGTPSLQGLKLTTNIILPGPPTCVLSGIDAL